MPARNGHRTSLHDQHLMADSESPSSEYQATCLVLHIRGEDYDVGMFLKVWGLGPIQRHSHRGTPFTNIYGHLWALSSGRALPQVNHLTHDPLLYSYLTHRTSSGVSVTTVTPGGCTGTSSCWQRSATSSSCEISHEGDTRETSQ